MRTTSLRNLKVATALAVTLAWAVTDAEGASNPVSSPLLDSLAVTEWQRGRTTFYGKDGYSIHSGACHYGGIPYPYFIGALSDWWPTYQCGDCFEIQCDQNGRGEYCRGDRLNASIIVRVTDRCPCDHPNPSNKRWCCGDQAHFDVSHEAFGEIANHVGGWVYLQWRQVTCPDTVGMGGDLLLDPFNWRPYCDGASEKTIADMAEDEGLTTFLEAVWRAGPDVWSAVSTQTHQHSVFAPTNEAFEETAAGLNMTIQELLEEPSLGRIMRYHVMKELVYLEDKPCDDLPESGHDCAQLKEWGKCDDQYFKDAGHCRQTCGQCQSFRTLGEETVDVQVESDGVVLDKGHGPKTTNVMRKVSSCNGEMHVVDAVLMPMCSNETGAEKGIMEMAKDVGLMLFTQAVWKANAVSPNALGVGNEWGLYTVLAPTDRALEAAIAELGFESFEQFLESDQLLPVMKNHVVKGKEMIGFFEEKCADLQVPKVILDAYPDSFRTLWNESSTVSCEDLAELGHCSDEWVSHGYCRKTCSVCKEHAGSPTIEHQVTTFSDRELTMVPSKLSLESSGEQLTVFSVEQELEEEREAAAQPESTFHVEVVLQLGAGAEGGKESKAKVLLPDMNACNGFLNVIDTVLI